MPPHATNRSGEEIRRTNIKEAEALRTLAASKNESTMDNDTPVTKTVLTAVLTEALANAEKRIVEYIDERTHDAETRLLRAFSDYQEAETTRFRHLKADLGNLNVASDERLAALERRIAEIDKRLIQKNI